MEYSGMSCLMENYCLKLVTPSEAVLYLLKTFDFHIKNARKLLMFLKQILSDNFCSSWNNHLHMCYWCLWYFEKCFSIFSIKCKNNDFAFFLFYFCFHNWGTLLNVLVFSLIIWTFCMKLSGAFKYFNWSW